VERGLVQAELRVLLPLSGKPYGRETQWLERAVVAYTGAGGSGGLAGRGNTWRWRSPPSVTSQWDIITVWWYSDLQFIILRWYLRLASGTFCCGGCQAEPALVPVRPGGESASQLDLAGIWSIKLAQSTYWQPDRLPNLLPGPGLMSSSLVTLAGLFCHAFSVP
jgi:hypothetical protein